MCALYVKVLVAYLYVPVSRKETINSIVSIFLFLWDGNGITCALWLSLTVQMYQMCSHVSPLEFQRRFQCHKQCLETEIQISYQILTNDPSCAICFFFYCLSAIVSLMAIHVLAPRFWEISEIKLILKGVVVVYSFTHPQ